MQAENNLLHAQLQITFYLQGSQQQIIAIVRKEIGSPSHILLIINYFIIHIANMQILVFFLFVIICPKIHGLTLVGKHHINNKITKRIAIIRAQWFFIILPIDTIDKSSDIIHGANFFLQGLLHNEKQHRKNHIHLSGQPFKVHLSPNGLLTAVGL